MFIKEFVSQSFTVQCKRCAFFFPEEEMVTIRGGNHPSSFGKHCVDCAADLIQNPVELILTVNALNTKQ